MGICKTVWALALVVALAPALAIGQTKEKSLYERLGGKPAITAVVDEFVSRVAGDARINSVFAATAADQLLAALGPMQGDIVEKK